MQIQITSAIAIRLSATALVGHSQKQQQDGKGFYLE